MKSITVMICWLATLLTPLTVFSQKTFISFGGELAIPSSFGLKRVAGTGIGGSFRVESSWGKHVSGMATISYLSFAQQTLPYSSTPSTTAQHKAIPIQVGLKYYLQEKNERSKGFLISTELGIMPTTTHFTYATNPDFDFKETGASVALGLGYLLGKLESSFRLQYNLTASGFNVYYYNFRLAYALQTSKDKGSNKE